MTSRLDRLVSLLDSGSTPSIRATAAKQLGQIARQRIAHVHHYHHHHHHAHHRPPLDAAPALPNDAGLALKPEAVDYESLAVSTAASSPSSITRPEEAPFFPPDADAEEWRGVDGEWDEVVTLLGRVLPHLRSKTWDSRVAAGQAIEAICNHVGVWDPDVAIAARDDKGKARASADVPGTQAMDVDDVKVEDEDEADVATAAAASPDTSNGSGATASSLVFDTFSLPTVLSTGTKLLASAGKEYDIPLSASVLSAAGPSAPDRLRRAKHDVVGKLGLGFGAGLGEMDLGMDVEDELRKGEEEAAAAPSPRPPSTPGAGTTRMPPPSWAAASAASPSVPNAASPSPFLSSSKPVPLPSPRFASAASPTPGSLPPPRFAPGGAPRSAPAPSPSPITPVGAPAFVQPARPTSPTPSGDRSASPMGVGGEAGDEDDLSHLSARERNRLKRKRKAEGKGAGGGATSMGSSKTRVVDTPLPSPSLPSPSFPPTLKVRTPSATAPAPTPGWATTASSTAEASDYVSAKPPPPGRSSRPPTPGPTSDSVATASTSPAPAPAPDAVSAEPASSNDVLLVEHGEWPFRAVVDLLSLDLFNPQWEIRHGAALGLRELLKLQGSGGGKSSDPSATVSSNAAWHKAWSDDLAIKLLCVLALDRFGDFVGDQVVAPVRETASQTLASLLRHVPTSSAVEVHRILIAMIRQEHVKNEPEVAGAADGAAADANAESAPQGRRGSAAGQHQRRGRGRPRMTAAAPERRSEWRRNGYVWEVRHAGLLGLKYEVAVRRDLLVADDERRQPVIKMETDDTGARAPSQPQPQDLLREVVDVAVLGLSDSDDDVRGVAAATLLPIADVLISRLSQSEIVAVLNVLWDCLGNTKDDLSSSTGGVMDLLSKFIKYPSVMDQLNSPSNDRSISTLVPLLYPFFRHAITSVRLSVLKALKIFLSVSTISNDWIDDRLLRLLFQNLVVEERIVIREASADAWALATRILARDPARLRAAIAPHLVNWFRIIMTPLGSPIDQTLFFKPSSAFSDLSVVEAMDGDVGGRHDVDKGILAQDLALVGIDTVIRGRLGAAVALGRILAESEWPRDDDEVTFGGQLRTYIDSPSALQKFLSAAIVQEWAEAWDDAQKDSSLTSSSPLCQSLSSRLVALLEGEPPATYAEMTVILQRIQFECQNLYNSFANEAKLAKAKVPALPSQVDPLGVQADAFTVDTARHVVQEGFDALLVQVGSKAKKAALPLLEDRKRKIVASIGYYQATKAKQDTQVFAAVAGAVIALRVLPAKLNPVIRSIMNSVKFEENVDLQTRSARTIASFVAFCNSPESTTRANVSEKIVKNLCTFLCQDVSVTPIFAERRHVKEGILSLSDPPARSFAKGGKVDTPPLSEEDAQTKLIRRGAEATLIELAKRFGPTLFDTLPTLWACATAALLQIFPPDSDVGGADARLEKQAEQGQNVIDCLFVLQTLTPSLDQSLHPRIAGLFPCLALAVQSSLGVIRQAAAKCFATLCNVMTTEGMKQVVETVVPLLGDAGRVENRQGSMELISHVVQLLDVRLLPYVIFLVVPVLGRMSDQDDHVRLVATNTFASLVKMVPLELGLPDPPGFPADLLRKREEERKFLMQLLDGSKVEPYHVPVPINAELRKYQQDGVSWLAFLAKYRLHGILCDDMGLGKTLQSITILSSIHHEREQKYKATQSPDARHLPSLIVCPPTLTGHWRHEILTYATNLRPLLYAGGPQERAQLQRAIPKHDAVIMSYDIVRNDIAALSKLNWNYCVLDEGHIIKNAKTKITKAVKMIHANHRLILSGTPIQNNVLELWSLFDFLMPGFLGTERAFHERYGKPILASRDAKLSSRDQEAGALALEALHKQVLPFLLRRLKEDVLDDLPPKIIQDIECELGDIQKDLYEDFAKSKDTEDMETAVDEGGKPGGQHVFQSLQYLRKLCNHPALVLDEVNPKHQRLVAKLQKTGGNLRDISHAPKLQALRQLLLDCGIGATAQTGAGGEADALAQTGSAVSQHRVLIFCQLKQMLDIVETDLLKAHMPSVTYLRLDGSVDANKRHALVQTFNTDPSIDCLLLTTQVGGLGLTLTGADTVIFVEHDWNPMKDLQAMDRAHRLGQKKVVNVYRLITRNTLEAKIMGLQRFKLNVANSVVTQQNAGLDSMDTDQLLDLFKVSGDDAGAASATKKKQTGPISQKGLLEALENMPDEAEQYGDLQRFWEAK